MFKAENFYLVHNSSFLKILFFRIFKVYSLDKYILDMYMFREILILWNLFLVVDITWKKFDR